MKCFRCLQEVPDDAEICPYCGQILKPVLKIDKSQILDPSTLNEGDMIKDRFEIRENMGSGGIGTVFKVYDTKFDVISIVKMLNREFCEDQTIRDRFFEEHRKVLEVDNDNLVKYYEIDEFKGVPFIVAQYVDGINLRRVINAKKSKSPAFSINEIYPIFEGIARALITIHKFGFHGDLKPENVIITATGIKVTDFAISRVLPPQDFVSVQLALGDAYYYLSPEYITDPEKIDYRVDIYALGVILYEMLTGGIPKAEPSPPSVVNNEINEDMDKVVLKAIQKDPEARYCCVEEFLLAFAKATGKVVDDKEIILALKEKKEKIKKVEEKKVSHPQVEKRKSLFEDEEKSEEEKKSIAKKRELLFEEELVEEQPVESVKEEVKKKKSIVPIVVVLFFLIAAGVGAYYFLVMSKGKVSTINKKVVVSVTKKQQAKKSVSPSVKMGKKKEIKVAVNKPPEASESTIKKVKKTIPEVTGAKKKENIARKKEKEQKLTEKKEVKKEKIKPEKPEKVAVAKPAPCPPGMVYIPPGYFIYGSPPNDPYGGGAFDKFFGKTYLKGYCIDKYEYPDRKGVVPRANVTYTEAYNLCKAEGKRLCTEAEWEKACKGPSNFLFPFGRTFKKGVCNTIETGIRKVMPSGSFPGCKSGYGVYDLCGNLLEWTATLYQQNFFITKGGSYKRTKGDSRCSARRPKPYYRKSPDIGFRCCKDAKY